MKTNKDMDNQNLNTEDFLKTVKEAHENKMFAINEVTFTITNLNFLTRRKVFSYFTSIREYLDKADFSFMSDDKFDKIMNEIDSKITVNGVAISKDKNFWEENANCYIEYVAMVLMAISYPFFADKITS